MPVDHLVLFLFVESSFERNPVQVEFLVMFSQALCISIVVYIPDYVRGQKPGDWTLAAPCEPDGDRWQEPQGVVRAPCGMRLAQNEAGSAIISRRPSACGDEITP